MLDELDEYVAPGLGVHGRVGHGPERPPSPRTTATHVEFRAATRPAVPCSTRWRVDDLRPHHRARRQGRPRPAAGGRRTLVTLLHLRDIADHGDVDLNIVSEMLDDTQPRTRRGHRGRRLHRQRQADRAACSPRSSENTQAHRGLRHPVLQRRQRDLPATGRGLHRGRQLGGLLRGARGGPAPWRDRDRLPEGSGRAQRAAAYGVSGEPGEDRPSAASPRPTRSSCWPKARTDLLPAGVQRASLVVAGRRLHAHDRLAVRTRSGVRAPA